jgi:choline dehydrogenase-like flavoprotein
MIKYKPTTEVDFVVIGSGAAGGIMAKELSVAGFSVVVLEQGGPGMYGHEQDYNKDELLNMYPPTADDRLMSDPKLQPNTFRRNEDEKAQPGNSRYGCVLGGGTVTYGGSSWRHLPYEFNEATHEGTIAGTGLADWPISYDELEPYYTKAEWEMGISGLRVDSPLFAPMSKPYPVPPMPQKASGALLKVAAAKLGLTVVPNVAAIISQPYMGRSGCINCGMCSGFGCQVKARSSSAVTMIPIAENTGRCEIRTHSYVREIPVDKNGRVTGAVYFDAQKNEVFQKAKAVVLSANGLETPRLLLLSKSNQFPDGLTNSNGVVGRYLMSGNFSNANGLFQQPLNEYKGIVSGAAILDYVPSDPKRGFYGGGRMTGRGQEEPIQYGLQVGAHRPIVVRGDRGQPEPMQSEPQAPKWGAEYKKLLREEANRKLTIASFITQLPLETNRVDLDPDVKDAWGLPAMRITSSTHPDDVKCMEFFRQRSIEILHAAGATSVSSEPVSDSRGGAHSRGTCRMGNDPKTSVVNKYHRAHDVPNLIVVDGSSFVTGGRNHPTMTIQALAFRAAEHLIADAKKGSV